MISFRVSKDTASPRLRMMLAKAQRLQPAYAAGAVELVQALREHLMRLEARGNKMGFPSRKFFAGGPDSVDRNIRITKLTNRGATVVIDDYRFAHRLKGGPVFPRRAKALAIPMTGKAYQTPGPLRSTWPGLKLQTGFLKAGKIPQFWLSRGVTHKPKPQERPDGRQYGPRVFKATSQEVKRQLGL